MAPPEQETQSQQASDDSSSSAAEVSLLGVRQASKLPLQVTIAGAHGSDSFLVAVEEIGLAEAAGAPPGDTDESVLVGGGRAFRVSVTWVDDDDETWAPVSALANGHKFCDEDGDLDPELLEMPCDVWQLAFGKLVAPLPESDDESEDPGGPEDGPKEGPKDQT